MTSKRTKLFSTLERKLNMSWNGLSCLVTINQFGNGIGIRDRRGSSDIRSIRGLVDSPQIPIEGSTILAFVSSPSLKATCIPLVWRIVKYFACSHGLGNLILSCFSTYSIYFPIWTFTLFMDASKDSNLWLFSLGCLYSRGWRHWSFFRSWLIMLIVSHVLI